VRSPSFLSVLGLLSVASALLACKKELQVPGQERVGTFNFYNVGLPLANDCPPEIIAFAPDGGLLDGGFAIDGGIVLSATFNTRTGPDGGTLLPDGGPIQPYNAGYLTLVDGSGSEYGTVVGPVFDVAGSTPRVFPSCTCTSISPADIVVEERNVLAVLSPQEAALLRPPVVCPPPDVILDGGIPDAGAPARNSSGVWSVGLVCGFTEDLVQVVGSTCTCPSCTVRFSVQGLPAPP
jgi:hypothetical protein